MASGDGGVGCLRRVFTSCASTPCRAHCLHPSSPWSQLMVLRSLHTTTCANSSHSMKSPREGSMSSPSRCFKSSLSGWRCLFKSCVIDSSTRALRFPFSFKECFSSSHGVRGGGDSCLLCRGDDCLCRGDGCLLCQDWDVLSSQELSQ